MNELPIMLAVWGVCVTAFVALVIYRSHLTRHEIGQVYLNENVNNSNEIQDADLARRVNRLHPFVQTFGGAVAVLAMAIIGVYVANILPHVRF